ncbi:hypothetical protein [Mucilaginibacter sp.]|jgi:hypothetical protein|uniref:hypothetical protein n=1 Tax=Mucilaginibacter sp. TaxID=1882438 RepID=UPI002C7BD3BE|nr:hypothetical protein [Mucilaginibacter sp.]HTI60586.1 hypothetical protein [Mucilaginibacter sp.]
MNRTYNALDLQEAKSNNTLKIGDHVTYDPINPIENGDFKTLESFKKFLSRISTFKHLIGEDYTMSWRFYEITELKD